MASVAEGGDAYRCAETEAEVEEAPLLLFVFFVFFFVPLFFILFSAFAIFWAALQCFLCAVHASR